MEHKDMIAVTAHLRAREGAEDALRDKLQNLVRECDGQKGLILYSVHQDRQDAAQFVFYEQFASQAALDAHLVSEPLKRFQKESQPLLAAEAEVRLLRMLEKVSQ